MHHRRRTDAAVDAAVEKCGRAAGSLLPVLQTVDRQRGCLDSNVVAAAADALGTHEAHAFGVSSFYSMLSLQERHEKVIRVCDGPVCMACGGADVRAALDTARNDGWTIERTSCLGLCDRAPAALVNLDACGPLDAAKAPETFDGFLGQAVDYTKPQPGELRVKLARVGLVNPGSLDCAVGAGAYDVFAEALQRHGTDVIDRVTASGLRGRGGAGFPTGQKLQLVAHAPGREKYVICNADESEPTGFKDRVLMESDPHLLLEGMALAAHAVGAVTGIIYIRGEYEHAAQLLEQAVSQATEAGKLGDNIFGSGFSFHVHVHRGAGAYICGEETALLESLEGRRGEPRIRPPYPTKHGYMGRPTLVNNVETLCAIPPIVANGGEWYRAIGTSNSSGTKLFTICGHVQRPGIVEVPFGVTLWQLIDDFAGGMRDGSHFKMALAGGAAGTIVGADALNLPLDFEAKQHGVTIGSGGFLILDDSVTAPQLLGWLLHFFEVESCGKCTPCREGTVATRQIVERFVRGEGRRRDLDDLRRLSRMLEQTSLCGLGQSVAWPIDSALKNFPDDFVCAD